MEKRIHKSIRECNCSTSGIPNFQSNSTNDMTSHHQQLHNQRQEIKRLRLLLVQIQSEALIKIQLLKREIINPRVDFNDAPSHWKEVLRAVCTVTELTPDEILCPSRKRSKLFARHMFNFICLHHEGFIKRQLQ